MPLPFRRAAPTEPPAATSADDVAPPIPAEDVALSSALRELAAGRYRAVARTRRDAAGRLAHELDRRALGLLADLVDVALGTSEATAALDRLDREQGHIDGRLDAIAGSSEELNATAAHVVEQCEATEARSRSVADCTEETLAHCDEGREALGSLVASAREAAEASTSLERSFAEIRYVAKRIDDIAEQIDLLALNAGIQAARAGVEGERFKVVAAEVKSLARETSAATEAVRATVDRVGPDLELLSARAERSVEAAARSSAAFEQVEERVHRLAQEAECAADGVAEIVSSARQQTAATGELALQLAQARGATVVQRDWIDQVARAMEAGDAANRRAIERLGRLDLTGFALQAGRAEHARWRQRLAAQVSSGRVAMGEANPTADQTRLGRWYASERSSSFTGRAEWNQLGRAHRAAHEEGRKALAALERGDRTSAERALTAADAASAELQELLLALAT